MSRKKNIDVEPKENTKFDILKKALTSSSYFKDASIIPNEDLSSAIIDEKYEVSIKNGYYMMTIRDANLDDDYCRIVDAIEVSLGGKEGDSLNTCREVLKGKISTSHISAEIYDTYKELTVHATELSKLYNPERSHQEDEKISVDEINYNVTIDDFLLTSITTGSSAGMDTYSICGHIYNPKIGIQKEFTFSLYNAEEELLESKNYIYENSSKKFTSFCVDFEAKENLIKYYSIGMVTAK